MEENTNILQDKKKKDTNKKSKKQEFTRFLKFTLFSCGAGIIQIGSFTILSEFVFHDSNNDFGFSYFISLILSVVFNFTINRKFTFKSASNIPIAMLMVLGYYAVFTPLSTLWGNALTDKAGWNEYLVLAINMILNFVTEFLFTRYVVFRKSINTQQKKKKNNIANQTKGDEVFERFVQSIIEENRKKSQLKQNCKHIACKTSLKRTIV